MFASAVTTRTSSAYSKHLPTVSARFAVQLYSMLTYIPARGLSAFSVWQAGPLLGSQVFVVTFVACAASISTAAAVVYFSLSRECVSVHIALLNIGCL